MIYKNTIFGHHIHIHNLYHSIMGMRQSIEGVRSLTSLEDIWENEGNRCSQSLSFCKYTAPD